MPPVKPAACMLVLILGLMAPMAHATTPGALWLHENWQLETSAKVQADGKALSTPGFRADGWLPITVPNTVLGAQVEAGLFPDPYYGNNLKDIPGFRDGRWMVMPEDSPYRVSWWYRTESLHVQYSYDDHSIWVVNGLYQPFTNLKVTARMFNMELTEVYKKSAAVNVGSDGKVKALGVEFPSGLSKSHFLALTLDDAAGKMKSENFYWLSTTADARGTLDRDWENFNITPRSVADHTDLRNMAKVALKTSSRFNIEGDETIATVTLENPSDQLAFFVHLAVEQGVDGPEVAPSFWEDNYLSLLPGRKRTVTGRFYTSDLAGADPVVVVDGWNVE